MPRYRLLATLAALVSFFAIGAGAAAQVRQGQQTQQNQAAEIERLRRELDQVRQPQPGQPLLVVPSPQPPPAPRIDPEQPMVELLPLLQRVERASGKRFIVDRRLGSRIYLGTVDPDDVTYPALLAILKASTFDGWLDVELDGGRDVNPAEVARLAREYVTGTLHLPVDGKAGA